MPGRAPAAGLTARSLAALPPLSVAIGAAAAERELPPAPGAPHEFRIAGRETLQLDNGLAMTFIDYGSDAEAGAARSRPTGSNRRGPDTWLPDVTVEMMKEGTTNPFVPTTHHGAAAAGMGGHTLDLNVGAEQTTAGLSVLSDHAVRGGRTSR